MVGAGNLSLEQSNQKGEPKSSISFFVLTTEFLPKPALGEIKIKYLLKNIK